MRVLVTGATGALGREVVQAFAGHEVVACDRAALDVSVRERVLQVFGALRPHAIVNTAAWTDVDGCEADSDRAFAVNAFAVRNIVEAARAVDAWVCHVSTDYVFDGTATRPYAEWDEPNPISVYGLSKLGGEREIGAAATVVRTSWLAGAAGRNFVKTILERAGTGASLKVVDDQVGCPTFTPDLAAMIRLLVTERRPGIYHVTNQGSTSWYNLAVETGGFAGLDTGRVVPIATDELDPPRPARRPRSSVLDNAALRLTGTPPLSDYHEPLERLVKELMA